LSRNETKPKRLVFASSLAAAGPSPAGRAWTEADPPAPIDPYGEAKAKAERVVASAPFPTTSFRPPTVLGPGDPYHEGHIHLDVIKRRGGYRMCQWDVRFPAPPIPLPRPRPAEADLVNHSKKL
jgi:nucleoside-diphosphate-sugar epimerase